MTKLERIYAMWETVAATPRFGLCKTLIFFTWRTRILRLSRKSSRGVKRQNCLLSCAKHPLLRTWGTNNSRFCILSLWMRFELVGARSFSRVKKWHICTLSKKVKSNRASKSTRISLTIWKLIPKRSSSSLGKPKASTQSTWRRTRQRTWSTSTWVSQVRCSS